MAASVYHTKGDGRWFPETGPELESMVTSCIREAGCREGEITGPVVAALAPHAGFTYSGGIAGHTYRALQAAASRGDRPDVVLVLGFSHQVPFHGVAWLDAEVIRTPMGDMPVAREVIQTLVTRVPGAFLESRLHAGEHSAENQLPFLQVALPNVPVIVGLMGGHDPEQHEGLAKAICSLAATCRPVVIASTDLLHDPDEQRVRDSDRQTLAMLESLDSEGLNRAWSSTHQICCGIDPVLTAIKTAQAQGCSGGRCLAYGTSADIDPTGRGHWVVGYGSVVYMQE